MKFPPLKKTVDSVTGVFNKAIADLQAVATREQANAEKLAGKAADLRAKSLVAASEADRALAVAAKLNRLVGA